MAKFTSKANSTKLPAMVLCLGEHPGGFCDVGCCCVVFLTGGFYVSGLLFPCHRHSTPASQTREGLHWLWVLPWLLSVALFFQAFLPQFYCERYGFEWAFFIHRRFFNLCSFTDIFGTFCNSNVGRNTPPRILLYTCPHRVVSSGWRMDLNYSYCSYKVDLSTVLASHVV